MPYSKLAFSEYQSVTTDEPVEIADVEDDLNRELAFYKQCLSSVKDARQMLKKEGVPFSRPADYFAEMVKSDEHMGKIKQKLIDAAAGKKAAAEARKQRDLKKFGKQVQVAKMQERAKEKRDTMDKINTLKRSTYLQMIDLGAHTNATAQSDKAQTLHPPTKKTSSTWPPPQTTTPSPAVAAAAPPTAASPSTPSATRKTKSTALAARSAMQRATTQSQVPTSGTFPSAK